MQRRKYAVRARIVKALANPIRLMMLDLLKEGGQSVSDLVNKIGCTYATASKHLSVLRAAGLVEDRKDGREVYYRLRCPCVLRFFECVEAVIREDMRLRRKAVRAR